MRAYFTMHNVNRRFCVMQCAGRIHSSHFKEISPFLKYNYENFRFESMKLFDVPDLKQTYLTELAYLAQGREEDYESYHDRVRDLVSKSHPELTGDARERLMTSYFTRGLIDDRVRDVVSATPGLTSHEALRRASAMASSRRKGWVDLRRLDGCQRTSPKTVHSRSRRRTPLRARAAFVLIRWRTISQ